MNRTITTRILLVLGLLSYTSTLNLFAQDDQVSHNVINDQGYTIRSLSSNGRYCSGYTYNADGSVTSIIYDIPTQEWQIVDQIQIYDISNNRMAVGNQPTAEGSLTPVAWKDESTYILPYSDTYLLGSNVNAISYDEKYMAGYLWKSPTDEGYDAVPILWTNDNYEFSYQILPMPETDWQGLHPQQVVIWDISDDASVIVGREVSNKGDLMLPLVWVKDQNGEYICSTVCEDLYFDKTKEHPGTMPEFDEYVTADPSTETELYNEQLQNWFQLVTIYQEKLSEYLTGTSIAPSDYNITDNGRFFATTVQYKNGVNLTNTKAIAIDTQDLGNPFILGSGTEGLSITDDGTFFYSENGKVYVTNVLNDTEKKEFSQYVSDEYGINIESSLNGCEITRLMCSSDKVSIIYTTDDGNTKTQYAIYAPEKASSVSETTKYNTEMSVQHNILKCTNNICQIWVYNTNGQTVFNGNIHENMDLTFLGHGIYIIKGTTNEGKSEIIKAVVQ